MKKPGGMDRKAVIRWTLLAALVVSPFAWSQSIRTDGAIETDDQLVSNAPPGTAPLAVSSTTMVPNLNADLLDGKDAVLFALGTDLLAAMAALDKPDPPCYDNTHRFVDCGNGTVTDTATGFIWLKDADCFPTQDYAAANATAAALFDGSTNDPMGGDCGLSDGSRRGDWRLPTKTEWSFILKASCPDDPELVGNGSPTTGCYPDAPWATGVTTSTFYWSSSSGQGGTGSYATDTAFAAVMNTGSDQNYPKTLKRKVWPIRNGRGL